MSHKPQFPEWKSSVGRGQKNFIAFVVVSYILFCEPAS